MKFKWANTILLSLVVSQITTGLLGLASGSPNHKFLVDLHGVGGWAIGAVMVWKAQNIFLAFKGDKSLTVPRIAFLLMLLVLLVTLITGILWTFTLLPSLLGFSILSWHIYIGLSLIPILIWHAVARRRGFSSLSYSSGRRVFLRFSAVGFVGLLLWRGTDVLKGPLGFLGASRRFTGSYERGSFSGNSFPVTSWLFDDPAPVDVSKWTLSVDGSVRRPLTLTYEDLVNASDEVTATIDCTGGWFSTQEWRGLVVDHLLNEAELEPDASSVTFWSVTGYYRRYAMSEAREALLATHVGGQTLAHSHGFPLRVVGPGKRGFDWVKWVRRIEVNSTPSWLQPPFPMQ